VALVSITYNQTPGEIGLAGSRSQESCNNLRFRMSRLRRTACKTLAPSVYTHHGNTRPSSRPPHEWLRSCKIQEAGLFVKNPQLTARGTNLKFPIFASPKVRFSYDPPHTRLFFPSEPEPWTPSAPQKIPFLQNEPNPTFGHWLSIRDFASPFRSRPLDRHETHGASLFLRPTTFRVFASPLTNTGSALPTTHTLQPPS
jgi:hypothetical protein